MENLQICKRVVLVTLEPCDQTHLGGKKICRAIHGAIHGGGRGGGRELIHPQFLLKWDLLTNCILFGNTKVYYSNQLVANKCF